MSLGQYNSLMSNIFNQQWTLAKLRAELKGRERKECFNCRKFRHLAHNYRNSIKEEKGKLIPRNKSEVLVNQVIRYEIKKKVKV